MGYSSRHSQATRYWSKSLHNNHFVIGVVEIINKQGYKKDDGANIVVVPEEEDIMIRYIFLYNNGMAYSGNNELVTTKIEFEKHYYSYIKSLNHEKITERKKILEKAYAKYIERKNKEMEQKSKIE